MSTGPVRVLLVSTYGTACGIACHSEMLKEAVESADPAIHVEPAPWALDPQAAFDWASHPADVVLLNWQAALHSRWTPEWIEQVQASNRPVVAVVHDTGVPNSQQVKDLVKAADVSIVHEPCADLPADKTKYWRMGVPTYDGLRAKPSPYAISRPILGTVGHDLPWKNWDALAELTADNGWGLLICTPAITPERQEALEKRNPWLDIRQGLSQREVVATLHTCDATACCYTCANTGQSGAVLLCIAALKPVLAFEACRQFRSLAEDTCGSSAIHWCDTFTDVAHWLRRMPLGRLDPGIVALAEQESWVRRGRQYARLLRDLAEKETPF